MVIAYSTETFSSLTRKRNNIMKLDIIGSVASGKTTLARTISEKYHIQFYEKDNIVWERTSEGDRKRNPQKRDQMFRQILEREDWIVEGSPRKVLLESFDLCDHIILLDVNTGVRLYRVFRRWIRQKQGKERYNSKPTLKFLYDNILWVFEYDHQKKILMTQLTGYGGKCRIFKNSRQVMAFIEETYGQPMD